MPDNLFITGMSRSGTTLVEKLLCNHPELSVLEQPFPFVFLQAKKDFYSSINVIPPYHVLGNLFGESAYHQNQFNQFLESYKLSKDSLNKVFQEMKDYSGQATKVTGIEQILAKIHYSSFRSLVNELNKQMSNKKPVTYSGSKEIWCEEFLPYLISKGSKCILITRDPRDVIASMSFGKSEKHIGQLRPTLFNLRNWRKSVAFAVHLSGNNQFLHISYEDLVQEPFEVLDRIASFLKVKSFDKNWFDKGIKDQQGNVWSSNSSFSSSDFVSSTSVGSYRNVMDKPLIQYIETVCFPEMKFLGYKFDVVQQPEVRIIKEFKEPFIIDRNDVASDYSSDDVNIQLELQRVALLHQKGVSPTETERLYIWSSVYKKYVDLISNS